MPDITNAIELEQITKYFPNICANDHISVQIRNNEIHAMLGENGAGKSTLMSIIFGLYQPDFGSIKVQNKRVKINKPTDASRLGIGMVHQHFKLVEEFTVLENIILGLEERRFGFLDIHRARRDVLNLTTKYGLDINADEKVSNLTVSQQQKVEILKMLYRNVNIMIFDEPSAVLMPQEIDELILILKKLKSEGNTIILITHKLKEILQVADRCSVLRRGKLIDTVDIGAVTEDKLTMMMVGRAVNFESLELKKQSRGALILSCKNLFVRGSRGSLVLDDLSLDLYAGEILGLAGVDGNGQSELAECLAGYLAPKSGSIIYQDKLINKLSIKSRINAGIGFVPEDRHKFGIILELALKYNISLKEIMNSPYSKWGFLQNKNFVAKAQGLIENYGVACNEGVETLTRSMSGGNQQKVILAREIEMSPNLLIIAQPTRGLDVGAIEYIHKRILAERAKGKAILLISFELDEILRLADRVATIYKGRIIKTLDRDKTDRNIIGSMMAGLSK